MMHERACGSCLAENKFYEEAVKPSDEITKRIRDEIETEDVQMEEINGDIEEEN